MENLWNSGEKRWNRVENLGTSKEKECTDRGRLEAKVKETYGKLVENLWKTYMGNLYGRPIWKTYGKHPPPDELSTF